MDGKNLLKKYSSSNFKNALVKSGVTDGDCLFIHSNIGFFGIPDNCNNKDEACNLILNAILSVIGKKGTVVVPTYTYSFSSNEDFLYNQKSVCGMFSEFVRKNDQSERTIDPIFSVSALGYQAKSLTTNISNNSFDDNSFFSRFHSINGKICNFNLNAGSTFIHYIERLLNVNYRYDKEFSGNIIFNTKKYFKNWFIWVRDLNNQSTEANFHKMSLEATNNNLFKKISVGQGYLGTISSDLKFKFIKNKLKEDPDFLIENGSILK